MARAKKKPRPEGLRGPSKSKAARALRKEEVERVMVEGAWSLATVRLLAERHGVSVNQIYQDRKKIMTHWQKQVLNVEQGELKAEWLQKVRNMTRQCMKTGNTMSAAKLVYYEGKAIGVFEPLRIEVHNIGQMNPAAMARDIIEALPLIQQIAGQEAGLIIDAEHEEAD